MRRVLLAVLLMTGATLIGAAPADAGGPTSVLLTNPGQGQATALYYSDPRVLRARHAAAQRRRDRSKAARRRDVPQRHLADPRRLHLADRPGVPGRVEPGHGRQHPRGLERSTAIRLNKADSAEVVALASSLGLMKPGVGQPGTSGEAAAAAPDPKPAAAPAPVVREETRWFSLSGWRWALPGLLVGLLAAVAFRGRRSAPDGPRQELIDGAPLGFDGFDRAAGQGRT